tara:strand:- start:426 stop:659 length:234 start_codon:yes stop_codon:yes gene_type:complete
MENTKRQAHVTWWASISFMQKTQYKRKYQVIRRKKIQNKNLISNMPDTSGVYAYQLIDRQIKAIWEQHSYGRKKVKG